MTVVDRFSKMVHFIALPKLPSAAEMVDLLVTHAVRLHGIPQNIVSDCGPSSSQGCGGPSAGALGPRSTYHWDTIPRPTGRWRGGDSALRYHQQPASWSLHLPLG